MVIKYGMKTSDPHTLRLNASIAKNKYVAATTVMKTLTWAPPYLFTIWQNSLVVNAVTIANNAANDKGCHKIPPTINRTNTTPVNVRKTRLFFIILH